MADGGSVGRIDYLLWRDAYFQRADIKPEEAEIVPGRKVPNGKVDREEWEYFFRSRDLPMDSVFDLYKMKLITGLYLSRDLQTVSAFYDRYSNYAKYIRECLKKNPKLVPGLSPEEITDKPEDLLALAQKFSDSLVINSWLGEAAGFKDVPDDFRLKVAEYLISQIQSTHWRFIQIKQNSLEALFGLVQSPESLKKCGRYILDNLVSLLEKYRSEQTALPEFFLKLFLYLLTETNISIEKRVQYYNNALKEIIDIQEKDIVFTAFLTRSAKLSEKEILEICEINTKKAFEKSRYIGPQALILTLAYAYLNPKISNTGAEKIMGMLETIAKKLCKSEFSTYGHKHVALALAMMTSAKFRPMANPVVRRNMIMKFVRIMSSSPEYFEADVPRDLFLNLMRFIPRKELTSLLTESVNSLLSRHEPKIKTIAQSLAVLINLIHDRDLKENDGLRALLKWEMKHKKISTDEYKKRDGALKTSRDLYQKEICEKLSNQSRVLLISLAGPDLYTSTFGKLFESLRINQKSIDSFLKELDRVDSAFKKEGVTLNFILTLSSFGKLVSLFVLRPDHFLGRLKNILSTTDKDKLIQYTYLLINTIGSLFTDPKLRAYKSKIEDFLLDTQKKDKTGCISFLIKSSQMHFSGANRPLVDRICKKLPEILPPRIPGSWIKNNTIKAKLFFYQDEHYLLIQQMYSRRGFAIKHLDEKTVEMSKDVNGIKMIIVVTRDCAKEKISEAINTDEFSIIGHRGHSYELEKTFSVWMECKAKGKLLYIGSCGGFRTIPDLMKTYYGNYFIAAEAMGRGKINNDILYYLLESIALNKKQVKENNYGFDQSKDYILGKLPEFEKAKMVLPHEKSLLLFDFLAKHEATR